MPYWRIIWDDRELRRVAAYLAWVLVKMYQSLRQP